MFLEGIMEYKDLPLLKHCLQKASRFPLSTQRLEFSSGTPCTKKEAKCHNGVNCCLKLINLNHLTISVDFSSKTYLFNTISIGTPGFTIAIFIHSLPKSTDITATDSTTQKKYQRAEIPHSRIKKRNL